MWCNGKSTALGQPWNSVSNCVNYCYGDQGFSVPFVVEHFNSYCYCYMGTISDECMGTAGGQNSHNSVTQVISIS